MTEPTILDDLTPAMMTMETDVELPSGIRANSIVGNLIGLKKGDLYVYAQELPNDKTLVELQAEASALRYKMRNGVTSSIRNAKRVCKSQFALETALVMYPSGRAFVQVSITCTDENADSVDDDEV